MSFLIASFYFFYFAIIAVHIIFLPKVLSMIGFVPSEIGIIFASAPLVRFIVPFLFLKGFELNAKVFNVALALLMISAILFLPSLYSFEAMLIVNIALGVGLSLILPYIEVFALERIGKERYGKIRLFGSIGFIVVALVLVKFLTSPQMAIYFLIFVTFFTVVFAYITVKNESKLPNAHSESLSAAVSKFNIFSHYHLWLGLLLMQVSFGAFYNFFTIYETAHGITLDMTIYLWSFGVIIEILMFYFQGNLLKGSLIFILQITTFVTAIRWLILYMFPTQIEMLFLSQSFHALSFALFHSAAISYLYMLYDQKKLAQQFFFGITYGLGGFIGAVSSGYVYEYFPNELFLVAALIALMASFFIYSFKKKEYDTL